MVRGVFPDLTPRWCEQAFFDLGWRQHGGSGLGRSYTELLAMPLDWIQRDWQRVHDRREAEAARLRER